MAEKGDKKSNTKKIIFIILAIIIFLLILGFVGSYFIKQAISFYIPQYNFTINETQDNSNIPTNPTNDIPKTYKTSSKLTEITFSRNLHTSDGQQTIDVRQTIKVSGYIQEVPLTQVNINKVIDRAYILNGGKLEWDIYGNELEDDEEDHSCVITWTAQSKSSTTSDSNGKLQGLQLGNVLSGKNILALDYSPYGFDTNSPEIALELEANIPMPKVENIQVSGAHTICNGETQSKVITTDYLSVNKLPLVIRGNPDITSSFTGNFNVEYDSFDVLDGSAFMKEGISTLPLDIYSDDDKWQISYNINMPVYS